MAKRNKKPEPDVKLIAHQLITEVFNTVEIAVLGLIKDNKEKTKLNAITKKQFLIVMKHLKDFYKNLN